MTILIVEDELLIAEMLKEMLFDLGNQRVLIANNFEEAIAILQQEKDIELCFLDIHLKSEKTGFDIAAHIREHYQLALLFLTSYNDRNTIQQAMTYKPEAYLIKPFTEMDLYTTLEVFKHRQQIDSKSQSILVKDGSKSIKLKSDEILYVKSDNIYVEIKTHSRTYLVRNSLSKFLEDIQLPYFQRIHRTYAINMIHLQGISGDFAFVQNEKLPISRLHKEDLIANFKK